MTGLECERDWDRPRYCEVDRQELGISVERIAD